MRHAWDERPVLYLTMIIRSKPRLATCAQLGLACVALARLLKATLHLLGKLIEVPDIEHACELKKSTCVESNLELEFRYIDPLLQEILDGAQKLHKEVFPEAVQFSRASGAKAEDWAAALSVAGYSMPKAMSTGLILSPSGPAGEEGVSKSEHVEQHVPRVHHCHLHHHCRCHGQRQHHNQRPSGEDPARLSHSVRSSSSSGVQPSRQRTKDSDRRRHPQKELLHNLDSDADAALVELAASERDLVEGLRKAAKFNQSSTNLGEIAANLAPLLVARKRLQGQMEAYSDGTQAAKDKSTPWERSPWTHDASSDAGEMHRFHLLAKGTDVADLAIERLAANKKADQRILRLTTPPMKGAEFVNGAWRFSDQSRPGSAGAVSSGHNPSGQRSKSSGPCRPSVDGRIRRTLTPHL